MNSDIDYRDLHPRGVIVRQPEQAFTQITITNPQYISYPEQVLSQETPNTKSKSGHGKEVVIAFIACAVGIILFSLFMGTDEWYYGIPAGVGVFIVLRALYGCYNVKEENGSNMEKPASAPVMIIDDLAEDPQAPV